MRLGGPRVDLVVRDPDRGRALLAHFGAEGGIFGFDEAAAAVEGAAGLINASPLGMHGFPLMPEPVLESLKLLAAGGFVFDMVYAPLETGLMRAAERSGLRRIDGLTMLVEQAAASFRRFFGASAPRDLDRALRERLAR
jgi:shikimate dehydrogenase